MDILRSLESYSEKLADQLAIVSKEGSITYKELMQYATNLAMYLEKEYGTQKEPVVVYGHKSYEMIICFLACVKTGRAYCPIDISVPKERVEKTIETIQPNVILALEPLEGFDGRCIGKEEICRIYRTEWEEEIHLEPVKDSDTFYIIFTSGSSGIPKGVEITKENLNSFLAWSTDLGNPIKEKRGKVFFNQAPFSFDLSVMDLYTCLASGGTLYTMSKEAQKDYGSLLAFLRKADPSVWVSTPSFADVCLAMKEFSDENLANLEVFLFCGETLTNKTAKKLKQRFPNAKVINTYGPTEATVAITDIEITDEVLATEQILPLGKVKPGNELEIWSEQGEPLPEGEVGEIIILGETVAKGYLKQPELTKERFVKAHGLRAYHTGDLGYLKNGLLYYCGRNDFQIKLNGYRIEIQDIENNLLKIPGIVQTAVLPSEKGGKVRSLKAFVVLEKSTEDELNKKLEIKHDLKKYLPDYMIPKNIIFLDHIPMTQNGKLDRKYLGGLKG